MTTIEEALDVLRAAGWEVREDKEFGQLIGPLLAMTLYDPNSRHYQRTVAQMPWTEVPS